MLENLGFFLLPQCFLFYFFLIIILCNDGHQDVTKKKAKKSQQVVVNVSWTVQSSERDAGASCENTACQPPNQPTSYNSVQILVSIFCILFVAERNRL